MPERVHLLCNVRIHTNSATALIEVPYHVCFVIQHMRETWHMSFLDLSGAVNYLVSSSWSDIQ